MNKLRIAIIMFLSLCLTINAGKPVKSKENTSLRTKKMGKENKSFGDKGDELVILFVYPKTIRINDKELKQYDTFYSNDIIHWSKDKKQAFKVVNRRTKQIHRFCAEKYNFSDASYVKLNGTYTKGGTLIEEEIKNMQYLIDDTLQIFSDKTVSSVAFYKAYFIDKFGEVRQARIPYNDQSKELVITKEWLEQNDFPLHKEQIDMDLFYFFEKGRKGIGTLFITIIPNL